MRETQVRSLGREDPLEREMATQYSCLENPMEKPGGAAESDTMKRLHFQTHYNWNKVESQGFILIQEIIA